MIISVTNQKGGVGKTTMLSSLATLLTQQGYKVLSVNLDPQRNLDMVAGPKVAIPLGDTQSLSILSVLRGEVSIRDAIIHTPLGDLIRASSQLSGWTGQVVITEGDYLGMKDDPQALTDYIGQRFAQIRETPDTHVLRKHLWPLRDEYDFIFLDTNPSLMLLTTNALYAADCVLIPVFTDDFSLAAIRELWDTIQGINYYEPGRRLEVAGIVVTKSDKRTLVARSYYTAFAKRAAKMGTVLFDTKIRQSVAASEATAARKTIINYAPRDKVADDYRELAAEFIHRVKAIKEAKV